MKKDRTPSTKPRRALGKGLEALIPIPPDGQAGVLEVELERIAPSRYQPRQRFDSKGLEELAASIQEKGVIQPIIVRQNPSVKDGYEVVAGERRLRAAVQAGLTRIPVLVRDFTDEEAIQISLIENIQREELNAIEEAEAYYQLTKEFGLSQEEVARRVGKDRTSITNTLRLLRLPAELKEHVVSGVITKGHARALLGLSSTASMIEAGRVVVKRRLSVRDTERLVDRMKKGKGKRRQVAKEKDPSLLALEGELMRRLGTKVLIIPGKRVGRIEIEYYSNEDLDRIVEVLMG
jgi:ParB family chromosome partitioning protein